MRPLNIYIEPNLFSIDRVYDLNRSSALREYSVALGENFRNHYEDRFGGNWWHFWDELGIGVQTEGGRLENVVTNVRIVYANYDDGDPLTMKRSFVGPIFLEGVRISLKSGAHLLSSLDRLIDYDSFESFSMDTSEIELFDQDKRLLKKGFGYANINLKGFKKITWSRNPWPNHKSKPYHDLKLGGFFGDDSIKVGCNDSIIQELWMNWGDEDKKKSIHEKTPTTDVSTTDQTDLTQGHGDTPVQISPLDETHERAVQQATVSNEQVIQQKLSNPEQSENVNQVQIGKERAKGEIIAKLEFKFLALALKFLAVVILLIVIWAFILN